ncbi:MULTISPECIES: hypothetical protein [unclassified Meridianimarinicoccus]|uniref:hypothetical protein n=1 Tax=unclassified Meridianimarinicoccus TaxID=2923344 RepID=UPI0018661B60|nr:hypothetical protein [Fluviibacterium sp. MJW13]
MFLELFATFAIGLGAAGVILLVNLLVGKRLPRWFLPAGAGLAMIGFSVWSEYTWYDRTTTTLPEEIVVAWAHETSAFYKPWTYVSPQVDRFVAVDLETIRTNDDLPGQRMVDLFFFGRWAPVRQIRVVIDCANNRRADLMEGVAMDANGNVEESAWIPLEPEDPVLLKTCEEEVLG